MMLDNIGKKVHEYDKPTATIMDEVFHDYGVRDGRHKFSVLQLLQLHDEESVPRIRFCYYFKQEDGKFVFANHPLICRPDVLLELLEQAKEKGWF